MKTKPFNLEAFKEGKPAMTRDGRLAKFIYLLNDGHHPVIAVVMNECGEESILELTLQGREINGREASELDLFMLVEMREYWGYVIKVGAEVITISSKMPKFVGSIHSKEEAEEQYTLYYASFEPSHAKPTLLSVVKLWEEEV